ncbi:c-type cytochrome [Myxococcus xanthus]|uniref:c-type cytochrome n=1 Tax=Myxococcus xanthus TaxID=34 RepID=UPI001127DC29|nr:cytochrome c family protein [Myxococcus xanthus]
MRWQQKSALHSTVSAVTTATLAVALYAGAAQAESFSRGNVENGDKLFKARCTQCHTANKGGPNKQGPNLYGIFERKSGSVPGYAYTDAMKNADIIWSQQTLFGYLENPKKYVPKSKMAFPGFKSAEERNDVIAYLEAVAK